jgi:methionine synthase I (cobalamin-dependent)
VRIQEERNVDVIGANCTLGSDDLFKKQIENPKNKNKKKEIFF